ncbi:hypothetical protein H0H92_004185 [Tricholoma furcatifolium]|nr:hypothetical protein H0H92_004185 [Tricholoma furcatifolium]
MSAHSPYPNDSHNMLAAQHEDYKASYDNLIDEFSKPFTANSDHQTFAVDAPSHRKGTSFAFNKSFSSKQSDDTSHEPHSAVSYPPLPAKDTETESIWQKILPESLACRLYIVTVLIETTIDLVIEGDILLRLRAQSNQDQDENQMTSRRMPVYLCIFALAQVFNALFLVYAVIQIGEVREALSDATQGVGSVPITVLTTIIPIVIAISEVAYIGLGWKIYHEFGWKVYKFLGADRRIKKMYANYQVYECLVKFDVFFWVGFSVQFIWLVLQKSDWEYYVTCAALPLSVILLVEGHLAARHENKWMMATFMCGCIGAMVYFVYKFIKVLMLKGTTQYQFVWKTLTVFSIIAVILLFLTMALSVIVLRNFGRGLKDALGRRNNPTHGRFASQAHRRAASTNLNRMSIN